MSKNFRTLWLLLLVISSLIAMSGCWSSGTSCTGTCGFEGGGGGGTGGGGGGGGGGGTGGGGGGGGGGGTIPTTAHLYYVDSSASLIGVGFSSAGTFANLSPFTAPALPSNQLNGMAIVNGKFLYIPMSGFSNVQAFSINNTSGALTSISGSPFAAQAADDTVTSDPAGRFLFVGGQFASSISVYQINATTGALTLVPGSPFRSFNLGFADSMTVDGTGNFLYVGQSFGTSPLVAFSINQSTGALTEISGSPFSLGVSVLQADPSGKFLLGIKDNTGISNDKHVYVFSLNPNTGVPTPVSGSPFATVSVPFALAMHPGGSFVYASMADSTGAVTSLEGFKLNTTTGALTALPTSPFTTLPPVLDCRFEQSGAFEFCRNAAGFSAFGVDTTSGSLSHTIPDLTTTNNFPFAVTD